MFLKRKLTLKNIPEDYMSKFYSLYYSNSKNKCTGKFGIYFA